MAESHSDGLTQELDDFLKRLMERKGQQPPVRIKLPPKRVITSMCKQAGLIFMNQDPMLDLQAPIKIVGDVRGQFHDLLRLFEFGGSPPESKYLFLGNYVDDGNNSLEVICLLLLYKIKHPEELFMLRGSHECNLMKKKFLPECKTRYRYDKEQEVWEAFNSLFNTLPVCAIIDGKIFCVHGGLSPELKILDQIGRITRPCDVPDCGLLCDLLWADPDAGIEGWLENDRGISFIFGPDVIKNFLQAHNFDVVVRSHNIQEDGYEFLAGRGLVSLFSVPNYKAHFDNAGAMMAVDKNLLITFEVLKPSEGTIDHFRPSSSSSDPAATQSSNANEERKDMKGTPIDKNKKHHITFADQAETPTTFINVKEVAAYKEKKVGCCSIM